MLGKQLIATKTQAFNQHGTEIPYFVGIPIFSGICRIKISMPVFTCKPCVPIIIGVKMN